MIQILGIRKYFHTKRAREEAFEAFFERGWRSPSVDELLADPEKYLVGVPKEEQRNLYFTVADCLEEKGRKLYEQWVIPIDIDGIAVVGEEPTALEVSSVQDVVCKVLGLPVDHVGSVFSGNGIWFFVKLLRPITDPDYFKQTSMYYRALCDRITIELKKSGLEGKADTTAWSAARLARMPGTMNEKPGKQPRRAFVVQPSLVAHDTSIEKLSGIALVPQNEQISPKFFQETYGAPDVAEIMNPERGCSFLVHCQASPKEVKEPEWFAMLSVTARFPNGREYSHQMSKGHPSYNSDETNMKIDHALLFGPRTCKSIESLTSICSKCPNYQKIVSPITLKGEEHIATEHTGFHKVTRSEDGTLRRGKPEPDDLVKFFKRKHGVVVSEAGSGAVWKYTGTHYEEMDNDLVANFAYDNYEPRENESINQEFFNRVRRSGMRPKQFFSSTIMGKVNFLNGVLDVATRDIEAHSDRFGFRSVLSAEYDEAAISPNWDKFLDDVTLEDEQLKRILQEFVGYTIASPDCRFQKGLALMGTGSNGKSVFVNLIKKLVSEQGFSSVSLEDMQNPQNRLIMEGKLVNIAEENSYRDAFKNTSTVKTMVTGGEVSVKRLYAQPYQYANTTKVIMLFNKLPRTSDDSEGFFRRLLLVPFDAHFDTKFGNKDINIEQKLHGELPGILNWAIKGYDRLIHQGAFTVSERSEKMLNQYKAQSNPILGFVEDHVVISGDQTKMLHREECFAKYLEWCEASGISWRVTKQELFSSLREMHKQRLGTYPEEGKKRINADLKRHFKGMYLLSEPDF